MDPSGLSSAPVPAGIKILKRLDEFTKELVPLDEATSFLSLDSVQAPQDRPWVWFNCLSSFDGIISLQENRADDIQVVSMSAANKGGGSDWRMLHCGWAMADAVLFGAESLRREPNTTGIRAFDDLVAYRLQNNRPSLPLAAAVSASGELDLLAHFFTATLGPQFRGHESQTKMVFTTPAGKERMLDLTAKAHGLAREALLFRLQAHCVEIAVFLNKSGSQPPKLDLKEVLSYLRQHKGVQFLDVAAGPNIVVQMLKLQLIDECRITKTGIIVGGTNKAQEPRAHLLHPTQAENFVQGDTSVLPLLSYIGIRLFGEHHLFVRAQCKYAQ